MNQTVARSSRRGSLLYITTFSPTLYHTRMAVRVGMSVSRYIPNLNIVSALSSNVYIISDVTREGSKNLAQRRKEERGLD